MTIFARKNIRAPFVPARPQYAADAVECLESLLKRDMSVLKFSITPTTDWFSLRVCSVLAVAKPESLDLSDSAGRFDVILLDGADRARCAMLSHHTLKDQGIIFWDDFDPAEEGAGFLEASGYTRGDIPDRYCFPPKITSVFIRRIMR